MSALRELQKPWSWLMQSLNPNTQSNKQKKGKGKKTVTQSQNISIDETPVKEEMPDIRVTRNSRSKRPKLDPEIETFSEEDVKGEDDSDKDFNTQTTVKHESPSTSKRGVAVKRTKVKGVSASQKPRRNSTRVTNKYRLKSKAMFNPSIKEENVIVIEDDSENVEAGTRKREKRTSLLKKPVNKGKQMFSSSTGPVTRATTRLAKAKEMAKGISEIPENKQDYLVDSDHISDVPEAIDSTSSDEEHSSGLVSKYQVKEKEPKVSLNLNEPAPFEECSGFRVKIRTDKERIKEFQKTVRQLKKEKAQIEQWNARQQERIQGFKKKKKEQREFLKELREINFRLYWHNVVLTTKLKQKNAKATAVIIS
jgi:hypothetical protein